MTVHFSEKPPTDTRDSANASEEEVFAFPTSFAQQRLWFIDQLEPGNPFYNLPAAVLLKGRLNVIVLERSFKEIVRRHEALRTTFATADGQPVQVIRQQFNFGLQVLNLQQLAETEREEKVKQLAAEEASKPFDLTKGPLLRASLLQLDAEEYVLLLTLHHIIFDGWSIGVFLQELAALYEAFSIGKPSPLPELPIQYADFAIWQREWLAGNRLQTQLNYWKKQLSGAPPLLELPADRPRPPVQTYRGAKESFLIPKTLTAALKKLSRQENATLFMTLLAAFKTLLYRYTGQADIPVGSPIANRNRAEIQGLIGFFVNTLVLRTDLSGDRTFRQLLDRIREVSLEAYAHQDLPFEKLVEELQPDRNLSYNPLFQVAFVLQTAPVAAESIAGLNLTLLDVENQTAKVDLTLYLEEKQEEISGQFEYSTDLFDAVTIRRMAGHFLTLLEGIAANPDRRIEELPLLGEKERHQLLVEWNDTRADYSSDRCIHQLFEAQVDRTPDAIAVVFEDQKLTYRELNERANQLAHYLQKLGVKPEVLVGICTGRSLDTIVGILGILKAGGAYVPLDPANPRDRLAFILEDAQVNVLLTEEKLLQTLPKCSAQILCIDRDKSAFSQHSKENPASATTAENLAYIIYTSGSTGIPKGVLVPHSNVVRLFAATQSWYNFNEQDVWTLFHSYAFDFSVWEIWGALVYGGRLAIVPYSVSRSPQDFYSLLCKEKVTVLNQTPSAFYQLIKTEESVGIGENLSLRLVIFGGEALDLQSLKPWFDRHGDRHPQLVNMYGITETTVHVTYRPLTAADLSKNASLIGRPIPDLQVYLLDRNCQPVPIGIPGEIYVGGAGVARGYLDRSELTADRFIPNPFNDSLKARLYKSGDLARYLPNGDIEYLGRIDHQVKVRGFRIELGEIEAALGQHPDVARAVVVVREDVPSDQRLVAYIIANSATQNKHSILIRELRCFLKEKLPEYMIPAAFVTLETLPLTNNGKVDRKALPAPDRDRPELEEAFAAPSTAIEKILAEIWAQVLGLEQVGIDDNFFELGGDSILSIQVISQANRAGLRLTPKQLFQHQTIAQLAAVADTAETPQSEQGLITGEVPLTPIQHWFFEQNLSDPHHWNQAVLLELRQPLEPALIESVLQELLKHHDALRLRFARGEFGWQQAISHPEKVAPLTCIDLSPLPPEEREAAFQTAATQLQGSLNLSEGPLLRAALFDFGKHQPNRLLLVIHHLAVDGVSWRILIEDFQTAYGQISRGETVALPPKTTSFKQWAERLHEWARSPELQAEFDYWFALSHQPISRLPVDFPNAGNLVASEKTVSVALSVEETKLLLQEVPAAYRTQINDVLLTALAQAFERWTGNNSLLLDLEGHGREDIFEGVDLSRTIGWFTAVFPVLLNLEKPAEIGAAIKSVKEQLRAVPNRGIGCGVLRYLNREIAEKLHKLPQAEVSFNYLGQFDQVLPKSSLLMLSSEPSGSIRSPRGNRRYLLEINGFIASGKLQLDWTYSESIHRRESIENLAAGFIESLRSLIQYCQSPDAGGCTPSDFAEFKWSQWSQDDLDNITAILGDM
ncbi:amino acid adenylation domain protein [Oscillatoria nigro-viridis PCC 7112]|uniref:Amino acid adenylation domain protein n=1 Tax=Phormidium nigroviride PCC 7112 TaxID=179408 RepID=K9VMV8_9CYAN|nr:non-ribosomal peptide synthetase [Oscillatoria nigro-viridis]AFZ09438.1 amino acid adenylation domain protein [Oscillatoria nigro-viridis PCC 7112]